MYEKRDRSIVIVSLLLMTAMVGMVLPTKASLDTFESDLFYRETSVHFQFSFDPTGTTFHEVDGLINIRSEGMDITVIPGEPLVPIELHSFVIDPYAYDIEIEITDSIHHNIPSLGPILGVPEQAPIGQPMDIRLRESSIPLEGPSRLLGSGFIRGYHIQDMVFQPIIPGKDDSIDIFTYIEGDIKFKVPGGQGIKTRSAMRPTSPFRSYLENSLDNPDDLDEFMAKPFSAPVSSVLQDKDIQYVIITDSSKVSTHLDDLKEWKISKGVPTEIVEMSFITSNYNGTDNQEKVRNFIKDAVATWDTEYILIGGDIAVVPYRSTYVQTGSYTENDCAADLYYSDLDGTFNGDSDTTYGETTDSVDMKSDVIVGRAPAQTSAEMLTFVTKTLKYEMDPLSGYLDNVTLAGEYLDANTNSSLGMDQIKNFILPSNINATSLFDSAQGTFGNLNRFTFQSQVNKGLSYAFHSGHSNYNVMSVGTAANGNLLSSNVASYNGGYKIGVMNSLGCIANRFSINDCIGELHVKESDGGSVVFIGNSRYGWYAPSSPGNGASEVYQRRMATELFTNGYTHMGEHFAYAKNTYTGWAANYNAYRWLQMALNMMGEPEMQVRTAEPSTFNITLPSNLGWSYPDFYLTVRDGTGSPVQDALVCLQQSDFYGYNKTDANGKAHFNFSTDNYDNVNVTVTGYNYLPFTGNISIDMIPPTVMINHNGNATTGDEYEFNCTVADEAGVQSVFLDVYPESGDVNDTITYTMDQNGTYWVAPMIIPFTSSDDLLFRMRARDNPGNWKETNWTELVVSDNDEPWFTGDITNAGSTTGENITFKIGIEDNINVSSAAIFIWWNGSAESDTFDMSLSSDLWTYTHDLPLDRMGSLRYRVIASDSNSNLNGSLEGSVDILDNDAPEFISDLTRKNSTTADNCEFKVQVNDNIGLEAVFVEYWRNGDDDHDTSPMTASDEIWSYTLDLPADDLDNIHHIFHAVDTSGNWNQTLEGTVRVLDNDAPLFLLDRTPENITTGEEIEIRIEVIDNIMVRNVSLLCPLLDGPVNMTEAGDDLNWTYTIRAPEDTLDTITYSFQAWDPFDNVNSSARGTINVMDNDGPSFGVPIIPDLIDAGDNLTAYIDIIDNIGLDSARMTWWLGGSDERTNLPMVLESNWSASFNIPQDAYGTVYFTIEAQDISGNTQISERFEVGIMEYIPPEDPDPGDDDDDDPVDPGDDDDDDPADPGDVDDDDDEIPASGEDLDADGMDDLWEYRHGLDLTLNDRDLDPDNDGYSNIEEFEAGTDPEDGSNFPLAGGSSDRANNDGSYLILIIIAGVIALLLIILIGISAVLISRRAHHSHERMTLDEDDDDEVMSWD